MRESYSWYLFRRRLDGQLFFFSWISVSNHIRRIVARNAARVMILVQQNALMEWVSGFHMTRIKGRFTLRQVWELCCQDFHCVVCCAALKLAVSCWTWDYAYIYNWFYHYSWRIGPFGVVVKSTLVGHLWQMTSNQAVRPMSCLGTDTFRLVCRSISCGNCMPWVPYCLHFCVPYMRILTCI